MLWDVFCKVIDNHGDLGVCWRLCCNLADRGEHARLWVDDASALAWMAPSVMPRIQVLPWPSNADSVPWPTPGDVVIEAFGCELPPPFIALMAATQDSKTSAPTWINLEYLTAEPYAEHCHALPSPVMHGPGAGLTKHFFYPGFTAQTGGLLRESTLVARQANFDRAHWLRDLGIDDVEVTSTDRWASLFCYEPPALPALLTQLSRGDKRTHLLVTTGRAQQAVKTAVKETFMDEISPLRLFHKHGQLSISYLLPLSQPDFDHLLWACDVNFVRGEDSLVRALWAGKPIVWQIYPQDDDAHHDKLNALLDTLHATPALRKWHHAWNGLTTTPLPPFDDLMSDTTLPPARHHLMQQTDLATQLQTFVADKRRLKS